MIDHMYSTDRTQEAYVMQICMASTRQRAIDHTDHSDHTDQGCIYLQSGKNYSSSTPSSGAQYNTVTPTRAKYLCLKVVGL